MSLKNYYDKHHSGKYPCTICGTVIRLEIHHIRGRDIDNYNHRDNLVSLCPNDHLMIHTGEILVEGWFNTTSGREFIWRRRGEESITGTTAETYIIGEPHESEVRTQDAKDKEAET